MVDDEQTQTCGPSPSPSPSVKRCAWPGCGKLFPKKSALARHARTHTGAQAFPLEKLNVHFTPAFSSVVWDRDRERECVCVLFAGLVFEWVWHDDVVDSTFCHFI